MVLPLLQGYFQGPVEDLQPLSGGNVAQTFSFSVAGNKDAVAKDYIIRFNATMPVNFEKEAYVYEHFASSEVPVPRVVKLGKLGDIYYAITEKARGRNLLQIPRAEYLALIPRQMEVLDAIHRIPVGDKPGYGIFDGNGVGLSANWRAHLEFVRKEEPDGDFFGKWHSLFDTTFLERDVFDRLFSTMQSLISYCPEERYLVHGNYGYANLLVQDGEISGVLDWMNARYGDFLYDVAWLDFWSPADDWKGTFQEHYAGKGTAVPDYAERVLCYQCCIAMDAMKFYAKGGDEPAYEFAKERIFSLLA
jgi:hygromycin-B 4-O-kinase